MMPNRELILALALVAFAALSSPAHGGAPKIEVEGGLLGDSCAAQRTDDDDKRIILTVELAADGRVVHFEPPRRITDSTVAAINATLRACRWQPAPAPRKVPVRVWVPPDSLF
jgi:hypothetical protein